MNVLGGSSGLGFWIYIWPDFVSILTITLRPSSFSLRLRGRHRTTTFTDSDAPPAVGKVWKGAGDEKGGRRDVARGSEGLTWRASASGYTARNGAWIEKETYWSNSGSWGGKIGVRSDDRAAFQNYPRPLPHGTRTITFLLNHALVQPTFNYQGL